MYQHQIQAGTMGEELLASKPLRSNGNVVEKQPAIWNALGRLDTEIIDLGNVLGGLETRLMPILKNVDTGGVEQQEATSETRNGLSQDLEKKAYQVRNLRLLVIEIMGRLEI